MIITIISTIIILAVVVAALDTQRKSLISNNKTRGVAIAVLMLMLLLFTNFMHGLISCAVVTAEAAFAAILLAACQIRYMRRRGIYTVGDMAVYFITAAGLTVIALIMLERLMK